MLAPTDLPRTGLLSQLWKAQLTRGYIADEDIAALAEQYGLSFIEVEGVASFYHFFQRKPAGRFTIYCNNSLTAQHAGLPDVLRAFEEETGASPGGVDKSGTFGLFTTPCIGLSDQEPAALINFQPFTRLTPDKVRRLVAELRAGADPAVLADQPEDNLCYTPGDKPSVFFAPFQPGETIRRLPQWGPDGVIRAIKEAKLAGRGGAFYPTWMKWQAAADQQADHKVVICNADEGEPGTFKDRVLMQRVPETLLGGMAACAYAIGANLGIIYLRGEYRWLAPRLQQTLDLYRREGWLGRHAGGILGFDFDVRLEIGAGAYVCGEETALLESLEGKRGEPRTKWFFPVEKGYLQRPTVVNNVETFCAAARILQQGVEHWLRYGMPDSPGTKLISVSGDCRKPGLYEIEWGMTLGELLEACEAEDPWFIQESGPSGTVLRAEESKRPFGLFADIIHQHIRCGGALTVFNSRRDILDILLNYAAFYKHESCGICTPCRAGNFIIERKLEKLHHGLGSVRDVEDLKQWGLLMRHTSRCGLGKTATNSLVNALDKFPEYFAERIDPNPDALSQRFDLEAALRDYEQYRPQ
jgi:[NiFe] hydrogenase diaphorase moiety large subunit